MMTMMQCQVLVTHGQSGRKMSHVILVVKIFLYLPCYHKLVILRELNSFCMQTLIFEKLLKIYKSR